MNDFLTRLTSRKFLLALLGIVTVFFKDSLALTQDQITAIVALIVAFTAAEGTADVFARISQKEE
jgi:hypothetical protein